MVHVDTNFLVAALRPNSAQESQVNAWLLGGEGLGISSVAWAEYLCGPLDATGEAIARQMFPSPEALLSSDAEKAAQLFNLTGRRSRSLADCMIAAVAIHSGAKMATINAAHFQPFLAHGLVLA